MIRVLGAEDQSAIRAGLVLIPRSAPDIEVIGEAADGEAEGTVKTHVSRPLGTLELRSRAQAAVLAEALGSSTRMAAVVQTY